MMKILNILFVTCLVISCGQKNVENIESNNSTPVTAQAEKKNPAKTQNTGGLEWYSIEDAVAMSKESSKIIFVDVYTDWCGWCKVMDKKTFTDAGVQSFIQENFIPVKFNAEQKDAIQFNGRNFEFVAGGRRGHHQLAAELLKGRLGYPSFAYLSPSLKNLMVSPGYKKPDQLLTEMKNVLEM